MPRVTKAQRRESRIAELEHERLQWSDKASAWERMAYETQDELDRLKALYTRVRVAIGGGTGQEPWDIFAKIEQIKQSRDEWKRSRDRWVEAYTEVVDENAKLLYPDPWHERVRAKVAAWWTRNQTAVLMYAVAAWIAGLWFFLGRASK